ncbi:hypothetical protein [Actinoplanes sp. TFC3]|uniref:hypothetical protein n=1 Tax=Actinoplanes sp. TFC3 TaxID=1710355 RepID=UPI0008295DC0|nr:hypothetical protein [Actinoplanes sp. TFC3]
MDADVSRGHLQTFLARREHTIDDLTDQIAGSFGEPELVVAAGSVQQGFGNEESDVDLLVFVDAQVTNIPISSHVLGLPVDINYLSLDWTRSVDELLATPGYDGVLVNRTDWKDSLRRFQRVGRLAVSLPLAGDDKWLAWQAALAAPVTEYAVHWWSREALRQRTAARMLRDTDPRLAAQRYCDAGLAALEIAAARVGELYVGAKWILAKLQRSAAPELSDTYRFLTTTPVRAGEAKGYNDAVEDILQSLHPFPADPVVQFALMPDVERSEIRGRTLLHRWGTRGVESTAAGFGDSGDDRVIWRGPASALDDETVLLARQGLVWLSITDGEQA